MTRFVPGQTTVVRYKDDDFRQIVDGLRKERSATQGTLFAFTGTPTPLMSAAARELASDLGLALHRVDLAAVISKFIEETEKNLQVVFAQALSAAWVLFFDEADALFGARSDAPDAGGRPANEVNRHLMALLAGHRGIVVGLFRAISEPDLKAYTARRVLVKFPPD